MQFPRANFMNGISSRRQPLQARFPEFPDIGRRRDFAEDDMIRIARSGYDA